MNIVGLGIQSPIGNSIDSFWEGLKRRPVLPIECKMPESKESWETFVPFYQTGQSQSQSKFGPVDCESLATIAIQQALDDAKLGVNTHRIALVVGTGAGAIDVHESCGFSKQNDDYPYDFAANISRRLGLSGPCITVSTACSASAYALLVVREFLDESDIDAVALCGVEAFSETSLATFKKLLVVAPTQCSPFTDGAPGTVLGDGAAAVVLRKSKHSSETNRQIIGIGATCDAYHATAPRQDGKYCKQAIKIALAEAGIGMDQIDIILPHGTGTKTNDPIEYSILSDLYNKRELPSVAIFPLKAYLGHGGGSSAVFSILALTLMFKKRSVPKVEGWQPGENYKGVVNKQRIQSFQYGLINTLAFGGNNLSVVIGEGT